MASLRPISVALTALLLLSLTSAQASSPFRMYCHELIARESPWSAKARIEALDARGKEIFAHYQTAVKTNPHLHTFLTEREALEIAEETDIALFRERLDLLFADLSTDTRQTSTRDKIVNHINSALLKDRFNAEQIALRIREWEAGRRHRWYRILGDRTLAEAKELYLGKTSLRGLPLTANPTGPEVDPNSLVGEYLKKTGASYQWIRYPKLPGGTELGPARLVVSVSAASFSDFSELAKTSHYLSVVGHANVAHRGSVHLYHGVKVEARLPSEGTPIPFLILKTSEAERVNRYLEIASSGKYADWQSPLKLPWQLEGYCAVGGYTCCTHWIGNIPIGDRMVNEYRFPGRVEINQPPRTQKLAPYKVSVERDEILKEVWKAPYGHEQLTSVIGQESENLSGNFASPGWVIHSLIGTTPTDRVPVVFVVTANHKAPIATPVKFEFEEPR